MSPEGVPPPMLCSWLGREATVETPERRWFLRESNTWARGSDDLSEREIASSATTDSVLLVPLMARAWRKPLERKKEKGESAEDKELRVEREDLSPRSLSLSLSRGVCFSRFLSFFARCSPTSSRLGSVQMTSNMAAAAKAHGHGRGDVDWG
jgi:hypothetical protein